MPELMIWYTTKQTGDDAVNTVIANLLFLGCETNMVDYLRSKVIQTPTLLFFINLLSDIKSLETTQVSRKQSRIEAAFTTLTPDLVGSTAAVISTQIADQPPQLGKTLLGLGRYIESVGVAQ